MYLTSRISSRVGLLYSSRVHSLRPIYTHSPLIYTPPQFVLRSYWATPTTPKPLIHTVDDEHEENNLGTGALLRGPFGTLQNPVEVPSILDSRIIGCLGHPDNPHDLTWHLISETRNVVCAHCAQVFVFKRMKISPPKFNWDSLLDQLKEVGSPLNNISQLKENLQERGLLLPPGQDNYTQEFLVAAMLAKGLKDEAKFVALCIQDRDHERLKEYLVEHNIAEKVAEYYEKREVIIDEDVDDHHDHNHDHSHNHDHNHDHSHDHNHDHSHDHNHDHSHDHNHDHNHDHDHSHNHDHDHSHNHDHVNKPKH